MEKICCIESCKNTTSENVDGACFYALPTDEKSLHAWLIALFKHTGQSVFRENDKICYKHFTIDSFVIRNGVMTLKPLAKPTVFSSDNGAAPAAKKMKKGNPRFKISCQKSNSMVQCSVFPCSNIQKDTNQLKPNVSYYPFPKNNDLAQKWKSFCNKLDDDFEHSYICSEHFLPEDFGDLAGNILKQNATPSIYQSEIKVEEPEILYPNKPVESNQQSTTSSTTINKMDTMAQCSVFTCSNVQWDTNPLKSNLIYYPFPSNSDLAQKWKSFCNKLDDNVEPSYVCSEHFIPDDFINLAGTMLKENAIPSIYKREIKEEEDPEVLLPNEAVAYNQSFKTESPVAVTTSENTVTEGINKMDVMVQCSVFTCSNVQWDTNPFKSNVIYYPFPSNSDVAQKWKIFCNKLDDDFEHCYVCSEHFMANDFEDLARNKLKNNAIPSVYKNEINIEEPEVEYPPVAVATSSTTINEDINQFSDTDCFKKGKPIKGQAREVVLRMFKRMKERFEKRGKSNTSTLAVAETVELTGVSPATVNRIIAESKRSTKLESPSRKVSHRKPTTGLDCEQLAAIKQIVYDYHKTEGFLVTNKSLTAKVNKDLDLSLSESSTRRILLSIGFKYKKASDNRKLLCERQDIRFLRIDYITKVKEFRSKDYDIVYILYWTDDSNEGVKTNTSKENRLILVHAGSDKGLVRNGLLVFNSVVKSDEDLIFEIFSNWLENQVIVNLDGPSVIVLDNASFQNKFEKSVITSGSTKAEMQKWLKKNNIEFGEDMFKIELYDLIKKHRAPTKNLVDDMIRTYGHEVLRLPSCHPDLNPMEKIWATTKSRLSTSRNESFKLDDLMQLGKEFEENTTYVWKGVYEHTLKAEDAYIEYEILLDSITDKLVISSAVDSSTSDCITSSEDDESDS